MGLLTMTLLSWGFFLVLASGICALILPRLFPLVARLHPETRVVVLRWFAALPVVLATLGVALCFAPKVVASLSAGADHCVAHSDGHPHFCFAHPPLALGSDGIWLGLGLVALGLGGVVLRDLRRVRTTQRLLAQITSTARRDEHPGMWIVESDQALALSVGVLRPRPMVSTALRDQISSGMLQVVVEHELAHARRRDGLWRLLLGWLSLGHLPHVRRQLAQDLEFASERACDEEAAGRIGSRVGVAEALVAVGRIQCLVPSVGLGIDGFAGHGLVERVEALLADDAGRRGSGWLTWAALAVIAGIAVASADPFHHLTETLIHHLLG